MSQVRKMHTANDKPNQAPVKRWKVSVRFICIAPQLPLQRRCRHRQGHSPSPRSQTLAYSHTATVALVCRYNGFLHRNACEVHGLLISHTSLTRPSARGRLDKPECPLYDDANPVTQSGSTILLHKNSIHRYNYNSLVCELEF